MTCRFLFLGASALVLSGCVAVGIAGNVAEGAVKTTAFAAKTTGKVTAAALLDNGKRENEDDPERH